MHDEKLFDISTSVVAVFRGGFGTQNMNDAAAAAAAVATAGNRILSLCSLLTLSLFVL